MEAFNSIYLEFCPNCGGAVSANKIQESLVCENCLRFFDKNNFYSVALELERLKRLDQDSILSRLFIRERSVREFLQFFKESLKKEPSDFVRLWAFRFVEKESFALTAPTGVGKTTFGIISAGFLLNKEKDSTVFFILPTRVLVKQVRERFEQIFGKQFKLLSFEGDERKKEKEEKLKRLQEGEFRVLFTTAQFFGRNFERISRHKFSLVFVDDADYFLKASKRIILLLKILGFTDEEIKEKKRKDNLKPAQLLIASATVKPKPSTLFLFSSLLGFRFVRSINLEKKVVRFLNRNFQESEILRVLKTLKSGILVYFPVGTDDKEIEKFKNLLKSLNFSFIEHKNLPKFLKEFEEGRIQVVIGKAYQYDPIVRGIDVLSAKYVIFLGLPFLEIEFSKVSQNFLRLLKRVIFSFPELDFATKNKLATLSSAEDFENFLLGKEDLIYKLNRSAFFLLKKSNGVLKVFLPDFSTFVQAEGRVSRLTSSGLSLGLSIVFEKDEGKIGIFQRLFSALHERNFEEYDLRKVFALVQKIEKERSFLLNKKSFENKDFVLKVSPLLVVVESPTKAKEIASFFGKPAVRSLGKAVVYEIPSIGLYITVAASLGHIVDLSKKQGVWGVLESFDPVYLPIRVCENGHKLEKGEVCSICHSSKALDKLQTINALRKLASEVETVYLLTDPDIEGEKIAYDVFLSLSGFNNKILRSEMHEITKKAFLKALKSVRGLDLDLINAQIVRRIFDRWVGFYFSQYLKEQFKSENLSAGRVQTPVLGWIIERFEESKQRIYALSFRYENLPVVLEFETRSEAEDFSKSLPAVIEKKEIAFSLKPPPPFETNSLLQELGRRFGFSAGYSMRILQELFEHGLITYHRTDSTFVSEEGRSIAKEYLQRLSYASWFSPRAWGEPGTHECIRPVYSLDSFELKNFYDFSSFEKSIIKDALKTYSLIFSRFIASQAKEVEAKKVILEINKNSFEYLIEAKSDGWTNFYKPLIYSHKPEEKLRELKVFSKRKVYPYTEAEVINLMKQRRLGRPSTYAIIMQTLRKRRYIVEKNKFLIPTKQGKTVFNLLKEKYPRLTSEEFTRQLEQILLQVEEGKKDPKEYIKLLKGEIWGFGREEVSS